MVKAAYDLFCAHGYLGTTISAVAAEAGVAVPTIYYTFGTKAALLGDALGAAIVGFDRWREPPPDPETADLLPWHQWWADFQAAPTSGDALRIIVEHGTGILQRVAPLVPAMRGSAGDPDAAGFVEVNEERRIESYREFVKIIAAKPPGLGRGLTLAGRHRYPRRAPQPRRLPGTFRARLVTRPVHPLLPAAPRQPAPRSLTQPRAALAQALLNRPAELALSVRRSENQMLNPAVLSLDPPTILWGVFPVQSLPEEFPRRIRA